MYSLFGFYNPGRLYWYLAGETRILRLSSGIYIDVSRPTGGAYIAGENPIWTGGTLNGIVLLHNGVDVPQALNSGSGYFRDLPNWPPQTRCKAICPYLQWLVALNVTKSDGVNYFTMVKWSASAAAGNLPVSWDNTDPTLDAGEATLSDTPGSCVWLESLGDVGIIYKSDAIYAMQYVGGTGTFAFRRLFKIDGPLNARCVVSLRNKHLVVAYNDVYVHDGSSIESVVTDRIRKELFDSITSLEYVFARHDERNNEVWICVPTDRLSDGITPNENFRATRAYVWNYRDNVWSERDLPDISDALYYVVNTSSADETWNEDSSGISFEDDVDVYNYQTYNPSIFDLVLLRPTPNNQQKFSLYRANTTHKFDGKAITTILERRSLTVPQKIDTTSVKFVRAIYPHFEGSGDVQVYLGSQMKRSDPVEWTGPREFTIGEDFKADFTVSARILSIRFVSKEGWWKLPSYQIDMDIVSRF
jgi:hypothetical protein